MNSALIIIPPLCDFYFTRHRFSALGADIVGTLLRRAGIRTTILNFPLMNVKGTVIDLPAELAYLKPYIVEGETGGLSFFTHYRRFGPTNDECVRMIEELQPDICFFSLFAFCYGDDARALAARIKATLPTLPLVIGGAGASVHPDYFLHDSAFDYALCGEAEACIPQFIETFSRPNPNWEHVPGIYKAGSRSQNASPAPLLPPPAASRDMVLPLVKVSESARSVTYSTSLARGCPRQCDFCSSSLLFGKTLRTAPLESLDLLLKDRSSELVQSGKRIVVNIEDDNILCDEAWLKAALSLFRSHFPDVEFIAENGLDYRLLTPELCTWLIDHNMRKFNLSLASTNPAILRNRGRSLDLDRYESVIALLAQRNIPSVTYAICGFGEDTVQTVADTLDYLSDKPTLTGISPFYPVPGLPGFTDVRMFDSLPARLCCGSSMYPWNRSLSTATLVTAFRLARLHNLKKSPRQSAMEKSVIDLIGREKKLFTLIRGVNGKEDIIQLPGMDGELLRRVKSL